MGLFVTVCVENTAQLCSNGEDDDGDGNIDCKDTGCASFCVSDSAGTTSAASEPEDTLPKCQDGIDNDGNGYVDCADFSCSKSPDQAVASFCEEKEEDTLDKCQDGIDNDGNGYVDCADYSCTKSGIQAVVDYCASILENTVERCSDGIDNDGNGYIDCGDFSCSRADSVEVKQVCRESAYLPDARSGLYDANGNLDLSKQDADALMKVNRFCSDGLDNDGDTYVDCEDWDCRWNPLVTVCNDEIKVCFE